MRCGSAVASTTETVDVVIGGPGAGITTLKGFSFDVTYDPTKLEFVPAATPTSPLMPDALVIVVLANGLPGRVVVGIAQPGTLPDVAVSPGQHSVLSLTFRRAAGATFGPTPLMFDQAAATSPSTTITFASSLTLEYH
jgi:hypothetical protein